MSNRFTCNQLTSLKGIEKFPSLEMLILKNCKKVTDYAMLKGSAKIVFIETP
ncbi:MAG: leucine-rich repeat domain-containing protein [Akkermansiaceae bacterium]|nr:leucine-rich repeat domain-containing protein [Akkermansiaceae bacterium]